MIWINNKKGKRSRDDHNTYDNMMKYSYVLTVVPSILMYTLDLLESTSIDIDFGFVNSCNFNWLGLWGAGLAFIFNSFFTWENVRSYAPGNRQGLDFILDDYLSNSLDEIYKM